MGRILSFPDCIIFTAKKLIYEEPQIYRSPVSAFSRLEYLQQIQEGGYPL